MDGSVRSCNYLTKLEWCQSRGILHPDFLREVRNRYKLNSMQSTSFPGNGSAVESTGKTTDDTCFPQPEDYSLFGLIGLHVRTTSPEHQTILITFTTLWFFTMIGNAILLLGFRAQSKHGQKPYIHQISLVASDIVSFTIGLMLQIYELLRVYDFMSCDARRYFNHLAFQSGFPLVNQALLICITLDRIQALREPLQYDKADHAKRAIVMNVVSYLVCLGSAWIFAGNIFEMRQPVLYHQTLPFLLANDSEAGFSSAPSHRSPVLIPSPEAFQSYRGPLLLEGFYQSHAGYGRETEAIFCITNLFTSPIPLSKSQFPLYTGKHKCFDLSRRQGCTRTCTGCWQAFCGFIRGNLPVILFFSCFCMLLAMALLCLGFTLVVEYRKSQRNEVQLLQKSKASHTNNKTNSHLQNEQHETSKIQGSGSGANLQSAANHPKAIKKSLSSPDRARVLTVVTAVEVVTALVYSFAFSVHILFDFGRQSIPWFSPGTVGNVRDATDYIVRITGCLSVVQNFPLFIILSSYFRKELKRLLMCR